MVVTQHPAGAVVVTQHPAGAAVVTQHPGLGGGPGGQVSADQRAAARRHGGTVRAACAPTDTRHDPWEVDLT